MEVIGLYSVLLLIYIGQTDSVGITQYDVQPLSISPCEDNSMHDTIFESVVTLQDNDGDKSLDFEITFDEPLNSEFGVSFQVDKWEDGEWEENVFSGQGPLCDYLQKFAKKAWEKVRKAVDPPVDTVCGWPTGTFKAQGFGILSSDTTIPMTEHGRLRSLFKIFNPEGDLVFCYTMEAMIEV